MTVNGQATCQVKGKSDAVGIRPGLAGFWFRQRRSESCFRPDLSERGSDILRRSGSFECENKGTAVDLPSTCVTVSSATGCMSLGFP